MLNSGNPAIMINCYNTFDSVSEILLGDVDHSVIDYCDPAQKDKITYIFDKTKQELNDFQTLLEGRGICVHRPNTVNNTEVKTPYWQSQGLKIPLTPRDNFLTVGDSIIETASWQKERFFESFYWRDTFLQLLDRGARWYSMPMPRHNSDYLVFDFDDDVPNQDPLLDNPALLQYGKDIFVSGGNSHNQLGLTWLKNMFPDYRYHRLDKRIFKGHLDSHLCILRPGLLLTYHSRDNLPDFFDNWNIIHVNPDHDQTVSKDQTLIDDKIQDDDFANTVLAVNTLSLDPNTVVMYDFYRSNSYLMKQFDKHKIEIVFTKLTYSHFFNQGVTCLTRDLVRHTDGLIDYTK